MSLLVVEICLKKCIVGVLVSIIMLYITLHDVDRIPSEESFEDLYWRPYVVNSFIASSMIPTLIITIGIVYFLLKNTYGLRPLVKVLSAIIFSTEIFFVILYQSLEVYYKGEPWPYWCLIILPRTIYMMSIILLLYVFISTCVPKLIYGDYPKSKKERVVTLFTLIIMAILPTLWIINGPYMQIMYLAALIVAFGISYCYKETFLYNSILHYTIYIVLAYRFYYLSGHALDFLSPKEERTRVGFPEFNVIITFAITIFDFIAMILFFLALFPITSMNLGSAEIKPETNELKDIAKLKQFVEVELKIDTKEINDAIEQIVSDEVIVTIGKNYVIALLFIDIIQGWITRGLVMDFDRFFFDISHVDFTFRYLNWAVYAIVALNSFLVGKA